MDTVDEAALILARLGRERDYELEKAIGRGLADAYAAGRHDLELKIATWGDIEATSRQFIMSR